MLQMVLAFDLLPRNSPIYPVSQVKEYQNREQTSLKDSLKMWCQLFYMYLFKMHVQRLSFVCNTHVSLEKKTYRPIAQYHLFLLDECS